MKNCERCNAVIDETKLSKWATGRFCSRKCANSRSWTDENKSKVSLSCRNSQRLKEAQKLRRKIKQEHICIKCSSKFTDSLRKGRKILCKGCRRKTSQSFDGTLDSFYKLSSRTRSKILRRMNIGCSHCGWKVGAIDLHHIIERKNGGSNDMDNLSPVCPNCHRLIHEGKLTRTDIKSLDELATAFDWTDYYFPDKAGL